MSDCIKYNLCANADSKCHLCTRLSLFVPGNRSQAKGANNEKKVAKLRDTKAHLRAGSGAVADSKGDIIDIDALHECKDGYGKHNARGAKTMTIQRGWLLKIQQEALQVGRLPVLDLHFNGAPDDEQWSVVRASTLFDLLTENRELRARMKDQP